MPVRRLPGPAPVSPAAIGRRTMPQENDKKTGQNAADDNLQGGTQGAPASPLMQPGGAPGGTNALSPAGTARPQGHTPEPPTGDKAAAERQDPHRLGRDQRTKPEP